MINDEGAGRLLGAIFGGGDIDIEKEFEDPYLVRLHLLLAIDEIALAREEPARDREIMFLRFGLERRNWRRLSDLERRKPATFKAIGAIVHLSAGRVSQIVTQFLRRMRHPFYCRGYRPGREI